MLALFLGGIGAHKFYLGRIGQGLLYAVFFWTWIPLILSIIDLIRYAFTSESKWDRKYNQRFIQKFGKVGA